MIRNMGWACCALVGLLVAGCDDSGGGGGGGGGISSGGGGISSTRLAELRRCMRASASPRAPVDVPAQASGYDLVRAYRSCRDPAVEADAAGPFRDAIAGFAEAVDGAWPLYTLSVGPSAGAGP